MAELFIVEQKLEASEPEH